MKTVKLSEELIGILKHLILEKIDSGGTLPAMTYRLILIYDALKEAESA